ncbi:MAG: M48 family metalloprotease [Gemmatimonadales bacterium]|jgi:predicted Zn-dependent protease
MTPHVKRWLPAVTATLLLTGCATNPATGGRMLSLVSEGQEIQMGQEAQQQVNAQMGLYDDQALQAYVDSVGQALAATSERPNLPWSFAIVDDPVINAFALPGGPVYLARGIMAYFNSEAEMASVLGHEIGHITARHSVEQISRAQLAQIGFVAGMVAVPELRPFGDVLSGGLGLLFLKYSRDDESQADLLGHRYMLRLGYDPEGAVEMFQILERQRQASGSGIPEWQSSHPNPGNRVEAARERVQEDGNPGGIVRRDPYLHRIEGLVYGPDPREGYFRDDRFIHPDMRFRLDFPSGWQRQNTPMVVQAMSPDKDAVVELTIVPDKTPAQAAAEFWDIQGLQRLGSSNQTVNGLPAVLGRFRVTRQQGQALEGLVMFVEHRGQTFRVLGYTTADRAGRYSPTFERTLGSFAPETDARLLDVEPKRIDVIELPESMSVESFNQRYPSTIEFQDVLMLNGWSEGQRLAAGSLAKRVVGSGGPR